MRRSRRQIIRTSPSTMSLLSRFCHALLVLLFVGWGSQARSQTATLTTPTSSYSAAGGQVTLNASIDYSTKTDPTALGYTITLPAGWTMVSVGGLNRPSIVPASGASGLLEFAYTSFPANSVSFSVVVAYPAGLTGNQSLSATAIYRSPLANITVTPIVIAAPTAALSITSQPTSQTVASGQPLTLAVSTTGGGGTPTFQWRKSGNAIAGATSSTYRITAVQTSDAGSYDVVVTAGSASITSSAANVTVLPAVVAPSISTQPLSASAVVGRSLSLTVTATGTQPLTYQWYKSGITIAGATSSSLTFAAISSADVGGYTVTVSNSAGSVTSSVATVTVGTVATAPSITSQPVSLTVNAGEDAALSVTASGTGPLSYQWRKDGTTITGATNAGYIATAAGSYSVVVSNSVGSVTSGTAVVTWRASALAGTYFGSFNGGGGFGLYVRSDRTGVFVGYAKSGGVALVSRDVVVDAAGDFSVVVPALVTSAGQPGEPARAAADAFYTLSGRFGADGTLSGAVSGLNVTLSAPRAATGVTAAVSGFYQAAAAGSGASSYVVLGAAGEAYIVTVNGTSVDGGRGSVTAAGAVSVTTERSATVVGSVAASAVSLSATSGGSVVTYVGANADLRTDDEKLMNLSSRCQTGVGGQVLIAGFVISGTDPKPVLIRAVGPTLAGFGLVGVLPAARLELSNGESGGDWGASPNADAVAAAMTRVGAFPLRRDSRDAAMLVVLRPGAYTATVTGVGGASGVCLVEVYDATEGTIPKSQRLINISSRALVGSGEATLIGGFVISGSLPKRVLIRGIGPGLAQFGVPSVLAKPELILSRNSVTVARNAGFSGTADAPAIVSAASAVGAFPVPNGSADAAILLNLEPGAYTAQVVGLAGSTGNALVEIYEIP